MIIEFKKIAQETQLPQKLPKVVYVYTTKNDFIEARILQNMQQTYKNMEVWISVGDPNDKNLTKIQNFCKKNKTNIFVLKKTSESKADNLNTFLSNNKIDYDYLLIGDADVAFDKNFVETSLKFFYSKRALRLGYVSSSIFNYRGNNMFTNAIMHFENEQYILKHQMTNFIFNVSSNLYSACCLVSQKMLKELNNQFPNTNLEDWYLEKYANKNFWYGLVSPLSVGMQSFDQNIWRNMNRLSRLYTWGIRYNKLFFFRKYNPKFFISNTKDFLSIFLGFIFIFSFLMATIFVWYLIINRNWFFTNKVNITMFSVLFLTLIIFLISRIIFTKNINKTDPIKALLLSLPYSIVLLVKSLQNWFNALFLSKYSSFHEKNKKDNISITKHIIFLFLYISILCTINFFIFFYKLYNINMSIIYAIVLFNSIFIFLFMYEQSVLILHVASKIPSNKKFNENNFVFCNNTFVKNISNKDLI